MTVTKDGALLKYSFVKEKFNKIGYHLVYIEDIQQPKDESTVKMDRFWLVVDDCFVLLRRITGEIIPICYKNEKIANSFLQGPPGLMDVCKTYNFSLSVQKIHLSYINEDIIP